MNESGTAIRAVHGNSLRILGADFQRVTWGEEVVDWFIHGTILALTSGCKPCFPPLTGEDRGGREPGEAAGYRRGQEARHQSQQICIHTYCLLNLFRRSSCGRSCGSALTIWPLPKGTTVAWPPWPLTRIRILFLLAVIGASSI